MGKTKIYLLVLIIFLLPEMIEAQKYAVSGTVTDENTKEGIEYATCTLLTRDSVYRGGVISKSEGHFSIDNLSEGEYLLRLSFIGYKTKVLNLSIQRNMDLGKISLTKDASTLKEVVIEAKRPFILQKPDRYIVNVSDNLFAAGTDAIGVLRNTPGVFINGNNIEVMGKGVSIWINNRPTQMNGEQLTSFLQSVQGENIDNIEVITNPSSKYDAAGTGGIININLKKSTNLNNLSGSVNAGDELSKRNRGLGGIDLAYGNEKYNLYGNYNFIGGNDKHTTRELTHYPVGSIIQQYDNNGNADIYRKVSHNYRAGLDLFPDKKNIVGFLFNGYYSDNRQNLFSETRVSPMIDNSSLANMEGKYRNSNIGQIYNVNYNHKFDEKKKQELDINADYAHFSNDRNQLQAYYYRDENGNESSPAKEERNSLPQRTEMYSQKADYSQELKQDISFETGVKSSLMKTDNNINYEDKEGAEWVVNSDKSNYFKYDERVLAAYFNFKHTRGKFNYQIGLRTEYTHIKGDQVTLDEINKDSYFDWFPSAYFQYVPNKKHNFVLSYNRRIIRPDFESLNPFEVSLDNYSFISGNPHLKPYYADLIDLKYSFSGKLMATLGFAHLKDRIFTEPVIDKKNNRYGYVYENFGRRSSLALDINYNDYFFKCWRINLMGELGYVKNDAGKGENVTNFDNNGFSGFMWLGNNFQIDKKTAVELNFMAMPSVRYGFMKIYGLYNQLSVGLRRSLVKDKATVSLHADDLLNGLIRREIYDFNDIYIKTKENDNTRNITLSFTYKFGTKSKKERNRNIGIEEEIQRTK